MSTITHQSAPVRGDVFHGFTLAGIFSEKRSKSEHASPTTAFDRTTMLIISTLGSNRDIREYARGSLSSQKNTCHGVHSRPSSSFWGGIPDAGS